MVRVNDAVDTSRRILILAPTGRDADLAVSMLSDAGIACLGCHGVSDLCREIARGAGACIITEEACDPASIETIAACLNGQPQWSDLPILLLTRSDGLSVDSSIVMQAVELFRNVLLLERPTRVGTLLSLVRSALRARERQYATREHLEQLEQRGRALAELTRELGASNDELRDFAYVASHDLKEPLRGIASYAHMLLEDCGHTLDEPSRQKLESLVRLPKRMFALLDGLLEYSRLGRLDIRREEVDLALVAGNAVEPLRPWLAQHNAEVSVLHGLPLVLGDPSLLERVFSNLIANGVKYNRSERPAIRIGAAEGEVLVADNGIGIPQRHHETVFRMFKRLHARDAFEGGTGAGLTIVRKIVEKHAGTIRIESENGEGTTFRLRFPPLRGPVPAAPSESAEAGRMRVFSLSPHAR